MSTSPRIKTRVSRLARNNQHDAPSPADTLLSRKTLRARWECSSETIRRRERAGQLHPIILSGRMIRYRLAEVIAAEANANATQIIKPQHGFGTKEEQRRD